MTSYAFNTRDIIQVTREVPAKLAHLAGQRGIILYHAVYVAGIPSAEAIMIGARIVETRRYKKTGQIDETNGGQIHIIPTKYLVKLTSLGAELDTDSVVA